MNNKTANKSKGNTELPDIETLLVDLQNKDLNYSNLSKRLKIIYLILVPVYIIVISADLIIKFNIFILLQGLCITASMTILAVIFSKYKKEYRTVNYAEPTLIMLKKAAYRYNPFRKETWWALVSVLLLTLGLAFSRVDKGIDLSIASSFLLGILCGLIFGIIIYIKKYKPLRDNALRLIKEIETN